MILRNPLLCGVLALGVLAPRAALAETAEERSRWVSLNSVTVDMMSPSEVPEALRFQAQPKDDSEVVLVKFPGPVTAEQRAALEKWAVRVYTYLPYDAFLVRVPAGQAAAFREEVGASAVVPYHPFYKISRWVVALAPEGAATGKRSLMVQVYPDADLDKTVDAIRGLGIEGSAVAGWKENPFFSRIRLLLTDGEIARYREDLARLSEVFWIDLEPRRELLNDTTVWVGQSGLSGGQATTVFSRGIFGEGQTIAVLDTGIDADMCYFRDTTLGLPATANACNGGTLVDTNQRKVVAVDFLWANECSGGISNAEWDNQNHGTHVAGTAAGDNFATPLIHDTADGMAPGAKLVIQDGGFLTDNCGDLPGIGCPVVDLNPIFQQTYDQGARIHSNSWGDNENAAVQNNYSAGSQDVDEFMWNHKDFLIFFAAGNSGPGNASVGTPSTAKSGVSVGSTLRSTAATGMSGFSSCGPTDDGRLKPEVTVPGSSIISAGNDFSVTTNNCGQRTISGTSMATPGAAGLTALIRQYYTEGWYPSGAENAPDGFTPSAALLRATLVNSTQNMTGTAVAPANCQGWGRVQLENALSFTGETRKLFARENAGFPTGSVNAEQVYTLVTGSSAEPLKVTLAWTDFPSTPAANPHINNDLDLTVSGPGGTFLGNVFSGGASAAGGVADRRNTLEQVLLAVPTAGTYTVTVRSFNVPNGPQPFALVAAGAITAATQRPFAEAGAGRVVDTRSFVSLDGLGSSDPDNGPSPLSYAWSQVSGPAVSITSSNQVQAQFQPLLPGTYVFQLQVSDGLSAATDLVTFEARRGTPR